MECGETVVDGSRLSLRSQRVKVLEYVGHMASIPCNYM